MAEIHLPHTEAITVAGHIAFDVISTISSFPEKNNSTYIKKTNIYPGGGAGNIAVGIAKLGCKSQLISVVGKDFDKSFYKKSLGALNINLHLKRVRKETAKAYIFIDDAKDQRTFFYWGASRDITKLVPIKCKILHLAPCSPDFCSKMIDYADYIAFEPGQDLSRYTPEALRFCLENSNIFFCNYHELQQACTLLNLPKGKMTCLADKTIVTYGEKGSTLHIGQRIFHISALKTNMRDPTGAGDGYRAGFWAAKMREYSDIIACRMGSLVSSFVVKKVGAQTNLPSWDQVVELYKKNFGNL